MGAETIIGYIVAAIGVSKVAATIIYYVGSFVLLAATTALAAKASLPGSPDIGAKTITSRGTVDPAKIIYGTALVAGTLAYRNAHGIRNRELWAVHVLAGHECESITDVYLDTNLITNAQINGGAAAGGQVTSGTYGPVRSQTVCAIYKHYGTSTQTANSALVSASSNWTTNHRLRGRAYAVTQFVLWDRTQTIWEAGDPRNVKFLVQGKKVYDPRLDSTNGGSGTHRADTESTWEWSDNPALCAIDYLRDSRFSPLAGGISSARIDWPAVITAADHCDELVFIPPAASPQNTQKRYTCNGVVYGTDSPEANVGALLSSFNGELSFSGGIYTIRSNEYVSPTDSLSADDIIGPITIVSSLSSDKRVNTIKAIYTDADRDHETTETAEIELYKDERDGGQPLMETIELPLTTSWYMAQRIALLRLQEKNQEMTLTVPCNLKAARFTPGQRINLTLVERGWNPKIFKVLGWTMFDNGGNQIGVNLQLKEDDSTAYGDPDVADYNTVDAFGALTVVDPTPVPSIGTLPLNVNVGEGAWNINIVNNSNNGTEDSDPGELFFAAGTYVLPTGDVRTLLATIIRTPYEGSGVPPDQVAYVVWGSVDTRIRFPSSPQYNFSSNQPSGLFVAIHDRFSGAWYAVDNENNEIEFTPASTDYIVARFIKTSASGGIDAVTSLVSYVENPQATIGATAGTDLFDSDGNVIDDQAITNFDDATALGFNPAFASWPTGNTYPDGWVNWVNGAVITKNTSEVLTGPWSAKLTAAGSNTGFQRLQPSIISVNPASVMIGSYDVYVDSSTTPSGTPAGLLIRFYYGDSTSNYRQRYAPFDDAILDRWQRVYFKLSQNDQSSSSGTLTGNITGVGIFVMSSFSGFGGQWTGEVSFDNLRFALLSPDIENESQLWADVSGTGRPADNATVGATAGTDLYDAAGDVLADIDVRNDQLVTNSLSSLNFNPGFEIPRRRNSGPSSGLGTLVPAGWYLWGTNVNALRYENEASRDVIDLGGPTGANISNTAIRAEEGTSRYEFVALVRARTGTLQPFLIARESNLDQLPTGKRAIGNTTTNPEDEIQSATSNVTVASPTGIGTSYTLVSGFYTPTAGTKWFSMGLSAGSDTDDMLVEWAIVRDAATRNTGALADLDTVDTAQIDDDAVTSSFAASDSAFTTVTLTDSIISIAVPSQSEAHTAVAIVTFNAYENTRNTPTGPPAWSVILYGVSPYVAEVILARDGIETASPGRQYTLQHSWDVPVSTAVTYEAVFSGAASGDVAEFENIQMQVLLYRK